jgi:hypothetical protein
VQVILDWCGTDDVLVVVEFPPTKRRPPSAKFARQSTLYLPHYGMAVGAVWCAGLAYGNGTESQSIQLQSIAADAWPWKGLPSGSTGKNKAGRQDYCRRLLKAAFLPEHLPNKGSSSDIADAMLIAEKVAAMTGFKGPGDRLRPVADFDRLGRGSALRKICTFPQAFAGLCR